jgi:hypothetical protein
LDRSACPRLLGGGASSARFFVFFVRFALVLCVAMVVSAVIGAAFGLEWRFERDDAGAELFGELGKNVIAPDAQGVAEHLDRYMAVAEMPGDAGEMLRIGAADFEQRFRRSDDFDEAAVLQHQRIAAMEPRRRGQIEDEGEPVGTGQRYPPTMPVAVIEHDAIGGGAGPRRSGLHCCRAQHRGDLVQNKK